jgi:SpoVK/Ycf46/Vps4 family AAA+-type ATPase
MFQQFLTWLSEHTSDVFVICTANQIEKIMETNPEFFRSERLDAVFFVDLPSDENKEFIWGIHKKGFGMEDQYSPTDELWTGAEIKGCCKTADLLDISLEEASELIVPVAVNAADRIDWVRNWATKKVLSADYPGIYHADRHAPAVNKGRRRKVSKSRATAKA